MYQKVDDTNGEYRVYKTDQSAEEVLDRAFKWRKDTDNDATHTAQRLGYRGPLKGRVNIDTLQCSDGVELYRLTIDGEPLLLDDEEDFGGWMTYHQLLCFIEGYHRLTQPDRYGEPGTQAQA